MMKILILFFSPALLSAISSRAEEKHPMVKADEIRGKYIKYITVDSCEDHVNPQLKPKLTA